MAKTKTTKQTKTKTPVAKPTAILRKGALAYVGLYGAAYATAKTRFDTMRGSADGFLDSLVEKGEDIEAKAIVLAKAAQNTASETLTTSTHKVRSVLPTASNDRVEELEAEVTKLNKKIAAMAKKNAANKKVKITTEKTVKVSTPNVTPSSTANKAA